VVRATGERPSQPRSERVLSGAQRTAGRRERTPYQALGPGKPDAAHHRFRQRSLEELRNVCGIVRQAHGFRIGRRGGFETKESVGREQVA